jgi:hypothetical protein
MECAGSRWTLDDVLSESWYLSTSCLADTCYVSSHRSTFDGVGALCNGSGVKNMLEKP